MKGDIGEQKVANQDTLRDDFFGIGDKQRSARRGLHVLAGIVCVIYAIFVWLLNPAPQIHGDQLNIVTMVISKEHPENFARDTIYGGKAADFYPFLPRAITSFMIKKYGIVGGHRVLQFPLSVIYLLVMYGVLYFLTRSVPASLLTALFSITWRWSLGGTYWGLDRLQAVQPRSFVLLFVPILFILIWRYRDSWRLLIPFFIAGLLFNLNPPSSLFFTALVWLSLLLINLRNREGIIRLIAAGAVFLLGASPYLYSNITIRHLCAINLSGQALQEHMDALQYRLSKTSWFPLPPDALPNAFLFGFSVPVFLAAIGWCLRNKKRNMFDKWLMYFFILSFVGPVAAQYAIQQINAHFNLPLVLSANCMRGQKYAYLVLYIYCAWLLAELFRRFAVREKYILIAVTAVIVVIIPPYGLNPKNPWIQWDYNVSQMDVLVQGEKINIAGFHNGIVGISAWAKERTPEDSLFLFASRDMSVFRIYALRSIVSAQRSGWYARFNGPRGLITWAKYQKELEWITARRDIQRLLSLAEESGADYIVTSNDFPSVPIWTPVMRDQYWTIYQKP